MKVTKPSDNYSVSPTKSLFAKSSANPMKGDGINDSQKVRPVPKTPLPATEIGKIGSIINTKA